jgi:(p)ppGpp synthase/HD superfamily hydrolase
MIKQTDNKNFYYKVVLSIQTKDKIGVVADIAKTVSKYNTDIYRFSAKTNKNSIGVFDLSFGVSSIDQLKAVLSQLRKLKSVVSIQEKAVQKVDGSIHKSN